MLHYTAMGPLAHSVQRIELLERQEKWQEKRLFLPLPSLHCFIVNCKRCGMEEAARTDSPISWLDKLNNALENWTLLACLLEFLCDVKKVT